MLKEVSSDGEAFRADLADALEEANLPTLLLALAELTGEDRWMEPPYRPVPARGPTDNDSGGFDPEFQRQIRGEALEVIAAWQRGDLAPAPAPTPERMAQMLAMSLGELLPDGFGDLLAEEMGHVDRHVDIGSPETGSGLEVLVVGAGLSGVVAAIEMKRSGVQFTVVEKDAAPGGTWYENCYPGAGVDTPSHLYSLSFAQRSDWPRYFAGRDQLFDYVQGVIDEHQLGPYLRFGLEVTDATWDEKTHRWQVNAVDGAGQVQRFNPHVVITGVGYFNRPQFPSIEGLEDFQGPVVHTAQWRPGLDLTGKRVGVIGTGASAMQLASRIAQKTERLLLFQRTPQWAIPHPNAKREVSDRTKWLMETVPSYQAWYRSRLLWAFGDRLRRQVQWDPEWRDNPLAVNEVNDRNRRFLTNYIRSELGERADELFDKCLPDYPPLGKRPLMDHGWFKTVARDDVELITEDISRITEHAIVTTDGLVHEVDLIVLATGFQPQRMLAPMEIRGRTGRSLRDLWGDDDARAYLGMTVPEFPNLFCLLGPNSFIGHGGSGMLTIELQVRYVMEILALMTAQGIASVECRQEVHDTYNEELAAALAETVWAHPGISTYYRNAAGRIVVPMPWTNVEYRRRVLRPDPEDFILN
jgi:4-hydroxyacetophenone monooxygenase